MESMPNNVKLIKIGYLTLHIFQYIQ